MLKPASLVRTATSSIALITGLLVPGAEAAGQEGTRIGLNLAVASSPQVGVTVHPSPTLTVRPAIGFNRTELEQSVNAGGNTISVSRTTTDLAFAFDIFANVAQADDVDVYAGGGLEVVWSRVTDEQPTFPGAIRSTNSDTNLNPRVFLGARVPLADRVSVFGEATLSYASVATGAPDATFRRVSLGTSALGVVVYIN